MVESKQQWKAWLYLLPAIILLLVFTVWPIINTVVMSFQEGYNMMVDISPKNDVTWKIGFKNYVDVFNPAGGFINSLKNTMLICFITVPISTFLALLIAVALNSIKAFQKFYQTIFFLPYVTNSIAIGMVFATIFNVVGEPGQGLIETYGVINSVMQMFGGEDAWIDWMNKTSTYGANIFVTCVYIVWNALPFKILILMGGLQSVNKQYYDAAKIDSTPKWRVFTKITVPLLSPMIAYVVITSFIGGFKEYSSIVGLFGEGMTVPGDNTPGGRLGTMVGFIYQALEGKNQGRAAAGALVLFGIIFVVTMINLYVSKKKTHY